MRLRRAFYQRATEAVARDLLGKVLVTADAWSIIVEVEAYLGRSDPASHAYGRVTPRNALMYGQQGRLYVYIIYGNHYCINAVAYSAAEGSGAVLIRGVQPWKGLRHMGRRRGIAVDADEWPPDGAAAMPRPWRLLTNGPGKLTQALGLSRAHNGLDLVRGALRIEDMGIPVGDIAVSPRIGISKAADLPLRFFVAGNPFVSRR